MLEGRDWNLTELFSFALPPMNFTEREDKGERGSVDLYARRRRYWHMHASVSGGRAY